MAMKPTIGRVVHFHLNGFSGASMYGFSKFNEQVPCRADICFVHPGDDRVNLSVNDHEGKPFEISNVQYKAPEKEAPERGIPYWCWMDYQVAKAAAGDHNSESAEPRPTDPPPAAA